MTPYRTLDVQLGFTPKTCLQVVNSLTHPQNDILEACVLRNTPQLLSDNKELKMAEILIKRSKQASHAKMRQGLADVLTAQGKIREALEIYVPLLLADQKTVCTGILNALTTHFMQRNNVYKNIDSLKEIHKINPQASRQPTLEQREVITKIKTCVAASMTLQEIIEDPMWQYLHELLKSTSLDQSFLDTLAGELSANYRKQVDILYGFYNRPQYADAQNWLEDAKPNDCSIL
jgi:hypothetical protein